MPLYFFDTDDNDYLTRDDIGVSLIDVEAAEQEAAAALPGIIKDYMAPGIDRKLSVIIRETDRVVAVISVTITVLRIVPFIAGSAA